MPRDLKLFITSAKSIKILFKFCVCKKKQEGGNQQKMD